MKRKISIFKGDIVLWVVFILLSIISLVAVYSSIGLSAIADSHSTPTAQMLKHALFVALSYGIIIMLSTCDYRMFSRPSVLLFVASLVPLLIVCVGHTRWLKVSGLPAFQPSELTKVLLMVVLARLFALYRDSIGERRVFWVVLAVIGVVCVLIGPQNLSTAILVFVSCYLVMWFAGVNRKLWLRGLLVLGAIAAVSFVVLYLVGDKVDMMRTSTWGHRIQNWIHPNPDELSQENIAKMAVARGGLTGNGVGTTIHGRLMTQAHNDFIFSIIVEEVGSLAGMFIFVLYAIFYFRCIKIATRCKGLFGSMSVAGIGTLVFLQAVINMSVALGVLPVTGQTLPFVSAGGSAYLFLSIGLGVIQAVAVDNKKQEAKAKAVMANEIDNNLNQKK